MITNLASEETQVVAVCDVDAWRMEKAKTQVEDYDSGQVVRNGRIGQVKRVLAGVPNDPPPLEQNPAPMPVPPELDYPMWLGPAPDEVLRPPLLMKTLLLILGLVTTLSRGAATGTGASAANAFTFESRDGAVAISYGGLRVADYVYRDPNIPRPYFAHLHAPGGIQVSRNHPPVPGQDATDHDAMHPGLWLAFGDISGQDFWRNRAAIRHERFTEPPAVRDGWLAFTTENRMQTTNGQPFCTLISRVTVAARPAGYLLIWDATLMADVRDIAFGDQEEMGLGVRVATPITEKNGGLIGSSTGGKTAKSTWGKAFEWCDYSGIIGDRRVGVTLMPDPANFRPSWFHNRDYGLMVANPFGRSSMKQGEVSRVEVNQGEKLRLRFGLLLHSAAPDQDTDLAAAYRDFLGQLSKPSP